MSSGWGWGIGAVVLFALGMWFDRRKKARSAGGGGVVFVRAVPRGNYVFRQVIVLAAVAGLAWFVYWVMSTHCGGGC